MVRSRAQVSVDSRVTPYPIELLAESRRADLYGDFGNLLSSPHLGTVVETWVKGVCKARIKTFNVAELY